MWRQCPYCGARMALHDAFCLNCRRAVPVIKQVTCPRCGVRYHEHVGHECIKRILPQDFQVAEDAEITQFIWRRPSLAQDIRRIYAEIDAIRRAQYLGQLGLRVSPNQFPKVYQVTEQCSAILGFSAPPEVFVVPKRKWNALACGVEMKFIVVFLPIVEKFSEKELAFVLGHEMGHILCDHVPILAAFRHLQECLSERLQALRPLRQKVAKKKRPSLIDSVVGLVSTWLEFKTVQEIEDLLQRLNIWQIASELTADRAGVLCCQDISAARTALVKINFPQLIGKINIDEFVAQYDILEQELPQLAQFLPGQTHPFTAYRVRAIERWANSPQGTFALRVAEQILSKQSACPRCGYVGRSGAKFCSQCGAKL